MLQPEIQKNILFNTPIFLPRVALLSEHLLIKELTKHSGMATVCISICQVQNPCNGKLSFLESHQPQVQEIEDCWQQTQVESLHQCGPYGFHLQISIILLKPTKMPDN